MQEQIEDPAQEARHLQRCINDLVSVLSLSAIWRGSEPTQIVETLLDVLLGMLSLDFAYGRLNEASGAMPLEILRIAEGCTHNLSPEELRNILGSFFSADAHTLPRIQSRLGNKETSIFPIPLGIQGEIGVLVVGSDRVAFPQKTENLLLNVAANQATIGLQEARLRSEQQRIASELEGRVAERTEELATVNEYLKKEIADRNLKEEKLRQNEEELRAAHMQMTRSEERWRSVFQNSAIGVALTDPDGRFIATNPAYQKMLGYTQEELEQLRFLDITIEQDRDQNWMLIEELLGGKCQQFQIEKQYRRKDGSAVWVRNSVSLVPGTERVPQFIMALSEDITERKRAEEAIRTSEVKLRQVIDAVPTLAWCNLPDGSNEFLNRGWHEYTGLSPEESHGWGWQAVFHPDDLPPLMEKWGKMLASGESDEIEARLRRRDGVYRWFLIRAQALRDESGNILRWYGTSTDIEDRKRAEEALRDGEQSLRLILDGIAGLVAIISAAGEVEAVNRQVLEYFGRSIEEMKGWSTSNAVHPDDLPSVISAWVHSVETASPYDVDHRLRRADGVYRWFHARGLPLPDREGRVLRWYVLLTDVDDRKRAEEDLRNAQSELARVMRVMTMGQLTASIAHEVNQPLSGIITNASTCLRMLDASPPNVDGARETARRTIRDGHRASDVVTRLRTLYSKKVPSVEPMDLNEAAREVTALSATEIQRNGVTVRHEFADDLPPALADRIQLQQVISNLLRNAADAMGEVDDRPKELLIRTERDDGNRVRLSVRDSGVGIAPQAVDKIFEAFYTTKTDGMGIGLSVSRSIIEAHQGRLWATPNDGPGCTFSFAIPCLPGGMGDTSGLVRRDSSVEAA